MHQEKRPHRILNWSHPGFLYTFDYSRKLHYLPGWRLFALWYPTPSWWMEMLPSWCFMWYIIFKMLVPCWIWSKLNIGISTPLFWKVTSLPLSGFLCFYLHSMLLTLLSLVHNTSWSLNSNHCRPLCLSYYPGCFIFPPCQQYLHGHH